MGNKHKKGKRMDNSKQDNSNKGKSGLVNSPPTPKGATTMAAPMNSNITQQCSNSQQAQQAQHDQTVSMMSECRELLYGQQCSTNLNQQPIQYGQGNIITQQQNSSNSVPIPISSMPDDQARKSNINRCQIIKGAHSTHTKTPIKINHHACHPHMNNINNKSM